MKHRDLPLKKTMFIWMNGKLVDWDKAKIHILSHVVHYGSGVFEGIRCYYSKAREASYIFRLKDHIDRLFNSAKIYFMEIPFTGKEVEEACKAVVKENGLRECYIRPIAYKAYMDEGDRWGYIGLNFIPAPTEVAIAAWEWPSYGAPILKCFTASWDRIPPNSLPTVSKACGQYLNSSLARALVQKWEDLSAKAGILAKDSEGNLLESYEAILLDHRGFVSEGTGENLFIVKDGRIYTPPPYASILRGITRESIIELARELGYTLMERDLTLGDLYACDECFMTGTAVEVKPVVEIDFHKVGEGGMGPVTKTLRNAYLNIVRGEDPRYSHWLSPIEI